MILNHCKGHIVHIDKLTKYAIVSWDNMLLIALYVDDILQEGDEVSFSVAIDKHPIGAFNVSPLSLRPLRLVDRKKKNTKIG